MKRGARAPELILIFRHVILYALIYYNSAHAYVRAYMRTVTLSNQFITAARDGAAN